ncbi:MAG: sulfatase [Planctomycetes bacterium]|nr:sulfatase [Planctomycetota bacterium]
MDARPLRSPARRLFARATRLGAAALACLVAACAEQPEPKRATHAILITCDTLRADRLGVYGYERATSPELDAFARDALVFDRAYSCAPWTQPALSSLLTGRPPEEIGVTPGNTKRMGKSVETLAETLRDKGFATAACVSNGLVRKLPPNAAGIGLEQGFELYDSEMTMREKNRVAFERDARGTTDAALAWLATRPRDGRFFLWVHFQDPHGPYLPPPELAAEFARPPTDEKLPLGTTQRGLGQIPQYQRLDGENRPDVYRDRYDAEIRCFDREFGRLIAELGARELLDDSIVVFTADHGESLGEHDQYFCHGENVQREQVHVPLLVRPPGGVSKRADRDERGYARSSAHVNHLDVAPTLFAALDLPSIADWRGLPLSDPTALPRDRALVQCFVALRKNVSEWAIGDGRWRLLWREHDAPRLYDVLADPGELRNVAGHEPEVVARLQKAYAEYERSLGARDGIETEIDDETSKGLEALGYVETQKR